MALAREVAASLEADVVITRANHGRTEALIALEQRLELPGDGQHDILLALPIGTDGTRILATVAGINGDDDVAIAAIGGGGGLYRLWRRGRVADGVAVVQIQHQAIAGLCLCIGFQREAARVHRSAHVEDYAQVAALTDPRTHQRDWRIFQLQPGQARFQGSVADIKHNAVGVAQGQQAMLRRAGQVKNDTRVIRRAPQTDVVHLYRQRR